MEDFSLIRDFALIMVLAAVVTLILRKLRQPPVLGYLLAGLLVSPYFAPFFSVSDIRTINLLAEIGLVLLLFGVGLEFGWSKIRQIGIAALVIGGVEIATMISLGYGLGQLLGWSKTDALFLGAALHTSSSAIIVKILKDMGKLNLVSSRVVVGILVVEDFAAVIIIAIFSGINTPGIASFGNIPSLILKLVIFVASTLVLGTLIVPRIIAFTRKFHSRETLLIVCLGLCFAMALVSKQLGLSVATGAFLMGALVGDANNSEDVVETLAPVRDMFAALFFVAIGMLIDISQFRDFLVPALIVAAVFIVGKVLANTVAAIISGYTARDSFQIGMSMPQMGEFSLAIAKIGVDNRITVAPLYPVIAIATTLTTIIAPYLTRSTEKIADFLGRISPRLLREYVTHLNDWSQTIRSLFSRQTEESRKIRRRIRTIMINLLILLVIIGIGTFALHYVESLSENYPLRRDIIALLLGSSVLLLCLPSIIIIWRHLRVFVYEVTRQVLLHSARARIWKDEGMRSVLRNSILFVLAILLLLWLIPLISQLLFIGSMALAIPALVLVIVIYMVTHSFRGIHRHLEKTFEQVFLGDPPDLSPETPIRQPSQRNVIKRFWSRLRIRAAKARDSASINQASDPGSDKDAGRGA